jgi:hypothetical protein
MPSGLANSGSSASMNGRFWAVIPARSMVGVGREATHSCAAIRTLHTQLLDHAFEDLLL